MLNLKSTVEQLNISDYQIDISSSINNLTTHFKANPQLPGVLLFEGHIFLGTISQKSFWQYMSRPYSLELAAKRKVEDLLDFFEIDHLIISKDSLIIEAAEKALRRSPDLLDQPIIIRINNREYRLLDTHQLLVGYAKIHRLTSRLIEDTNRKLEKTNLKLQKALRSDEKTGFGNQLLFEEDFARKWQEAVRKKDWLSIVRFDLDLFEEERNTYSQLAINGCLRKIGKTIEPLLNESKDVAVHYGDGRFGIILPQSNTIDANLVGEKIAIAIQELQIINARTEIGKNISLNMGIASIKPGDRNNPEQLLMAAEESLEKAKKIGKNCKIVKDISYSNLQAENQLPKLNNKPVKPKLNAPSVVDLDSARRVKQVS